MNANDNLISIIVPVYNVDKYINRCIESIYKQTYKNFEIILVDDASTDNSPEICDNYANTYPNITVIHLTNTKVGASDARNSGLNIAKGKFVTFIDSDDYVHCNILEVLINSIIIGNVKISMCSYEKVNDYRFSEHILIDYSNLKFITDAEAIEMLLFDQTQSAVWAKLYDIKLFNDIEFPAGKHNEDMFVTPELYKKARKLVKIPLKLYYYYQQSESLCRTKFNYNMLDMVEALEFWRKIIISSYPNLYEIISIHYYTTLIQKCQYLVNKKDDFGKLKFNQYKKSLIKNKYLIMSSKYTKTNTKIKLILLLSGLYRFVFNES